MINIEILLLLLTVIKFTILLRGFEKPDLFPEFDPENMAYTGWLPWMDVPVVFVHQVLPDLFGFCPAELGRYPVSQVGRITPSFG